VTTCSRSVRSLVSLVGCLDALDASLPVRLSTVVKPEATYFSVATLYRGKEAKF